MQRIELAQSIMKKFARETGLPLESNGTSQHPPRRYLWTDAFAVCNYLGLYQQSNRVIFLQHAVCLVEQVHQILGMHREDSERQGWLSGFDDIQAQLHPTQGGLRIGKPLDERKINAIENQLLEWQQDGQYFHYLTKWMHALNSLSMTTGNNKYNQWAAELAKVAFHAFVYEPAPGSAKRIYWKMSIDLSRPLVTSMGQYDPLDGLLTFYQLQVSAKRLATSPLQLDLEQEIAELSSICSEKSWISPDPLAIGGLLADAYKLAQLIGTARLLETELLETLLQDIGYGLQNFIRQKPFAASPENRLAFRELGLAIGLQAISKMQTLINQQREYFKHPVLLNTLLAKLEGFHPLHDIIEQFWLTPEHQALSCWEEHRDINNVMLATSLYPDGYLQL